MAFFFHPHPSSRITKISHFFCFQAMSRCCHPISCSTFNNDGSIFAYAVSCSPFKFQILSMMARTQNKMTFLLVYTPCSLIFLLTFLLCAVGVTGFCLFYLQIMALTKIGNGANYDIRHAITSSWSPRSRDLCLCLLHVAVCIIWLCSVHCCLYN